MKGKLVTTTEAAAMRAARSEGRLLREIAAQFGVSIMTVQRHTSEASAAKQRQWEQARYYRMKNAPEKYAERLLKRREYQRSYQRLNK